VNEFEQLLIGHVLMEHHVVDQLRGIILEVVTLYLLVVWVEPAPLEQRCRLTLIVRCVDADQDLKRIQKLILLKFVRLVL
jgi:hypothetical protein